MSSLFFGCWTASTWRHSSCVSIPLG